jgi:tetratricopeptide (TPR) repeat protein
MRFRDVGWQLLLPVFLVIVSVFDCGPANASISKRDLDRFDSICYNEKSDIDYAIDACEKLIENANPDYLGFHFNFSQRALLYIKKKWYDLAIDDYTRAYQSHVRTIGEPSAFYRRARGEVYGMKGDYDSAIRDFSEALRLDPNATFVLSERALAYSKKGEFDRAIEDLTRAIRAQPRVMNYYFMRGGMFFKQNIFDKSILDFEKAFELAPNGPYVLVWLGNALSAKGDMTQALRKYELALLIKESPFAYASRAAVYEKLGQIEPAKEDFKRAIQLPLTETSADEDREARNAALKSMSRLMAK